MVKKYVSVIALMGKKGEVRPLAILWDNGVRYEIDRILEVRKAFSQLGGCGILYSCMIQGQRRNLFYEVDRWFIESHQE